MTSPDRNVMSHPPTKHRHRGRITLPDYAAPPEPPAPPAEPTSVDVSRWTWLRRASIALFAAGIVGNVVFAPDGSVTGSTSAAGYVFVTCTIAGLIGWVIARRQRRRAAKPPAEPVAKTEPLVSRLPVAGSILGSWTLRAREVNDERNRWPISRQLPFAVLGAMFVIYMANSAFMAALGFAADASSNFGGLMALTGTAATAGTVVARAGARRWLPAHGPVRALLRFQAVGWLAFVSIATGLGNAAAADVRDGPGPGSLGAMSVVLAVDEPTVTNGTGDRDGHMLVSLGQSRQPGKVLAYDRTAGEAVVIGTTP